jgi:hypothetical protein
MVGVCAIWVAVKSSHLDLAPEDTPAGVFAGFLARQLQASVYAFLSSLDNVLLSTSQSSSTA